MDSETGNTTELSEKPRERVRLFGSITREELDQLSDKAKCQTARPSAKRARARLSMQTGRHNTKTRRRQGEVKVENEFPQSHWSTEQACEQGLTSPVLPPGTSGELALTKTQA